MKRYVDRLAYKSKSRDEYYKEVPEIDKFIKDIVAVYTKHNLAIGHEDLQGAFVIEEFHQDFVDWLESASDGRSYFKLT